MSHPNPSTALARSVVDQLAANAVETFVISPGSRSAAVAIAASNHPEVRVVVAVDERSAAFHALGVARATDRPAVVLTTSGTAASNPYPAVVEADMACVPLVVITADRPAELQAVGANQTIDQRDLFGTRVRTFVGIEAPDASSDQNARWRLAVDSLLASALGSRPGPVHLNLRFREPTVPVSNDGRTVAAEYPFDTPRLEPTAREKETVSVDCPPLNANRGVVLAGDGRYDRRSLLEAADELGWPVLATAVSGLRGNEVVTTYHHLLAGGVPDELVPETVVAVGAIGPSESLETLVATAKHRVRVDAWGRTIDPRRNATAVVADDPLRVLQGVADKADASWEATWAEADRRCRSKLDSGIGARERMTGAGVAVALRDVDWGTLVVSSSLPIREIDAHLDRGGRIIANRGASGIDGFVSTALGVASVSPRTLAVSGDLSLLHDANGFLVDTDLDLTVVVIDNRGGGLFDSLPQALHAPDYERLFVAPPNRDLELLARFHRLEFGVADDMRSLRSLCAEALDTGGLHLISVPVDRQFDLWERTQLLR